MQEDFTSRYQRTTVFFEKLMMQSLGFDLSSDVFTKRGLTTHSDFSYQIQIMVNADSVAMLNNPDINRDFKIFVNRANDVFDSVCARAMQLSKNAMNFGLKGYMRIHCQSTGDSCIVYCKPSNHDFIIIYLNRAATNHHDKWLEDRKTYKGGLETFLRNYNALTTNHLVSTNITEAVSRTLYKNVGYRCFLNKDKPSFYLLTSPIIKYSRENIVAVIRCALALHFTNAPKLFDYYISIIKYFELMLPTFGGFSGFLHTTTFDDLLIGIACNQQNALEFFITDASNRERIIDELLIN